jgi:hypothetical protein
MLADTAVVPGIMEETYPFSKLRGGANVLVFPDLTSANTCYKLLSIPGTTAVSAKSCPLRIRAFNRQRNPFALFVQPQNHKLPRLVLSGNPRRFNHESLDCGAESCLLNPEHEHPSHTLPTSWICKTKAISIIAITINYLV